MGSPRRNLVEEVDHDDVSSIADTDTTDTTLVGPDTDYQEQIESLKNELDTVKARCERAEREKSDILLRRLASYETTPNKTTASEVSSDFTLASQSHFLQIGNLYIPRYQ